MTNVKDIWHIFSTLSVGGPQRRFADYIARTKAGHKHHVYAMDGQYDALKLMDGQTPLHNGEQVIAKGNTIAATLSCRKFLKTHKPDLLVTYNWGATEWALANSVFPICPTIHVQDGFGEEEQDQEITSRRLMRVFAYRNCAKIIVPSITLEKIAQHSWHISKRRLRFIPNGIDIESFNGKANASTLKAFGIKTKSKTIGTVAALRAEKNIGRLIEAFSLVEDEHPDAQLVIVGDGVGTSALKMLAERVCTKGRVIFTGNLKQPEKILPAFDIFALSSDTEQMPLSVIEAMATGLPIVSTDVGDVRHMVSNENKPYVGDRDASMMAANLCKLLDAPDEAKTIGNANKRKAKEQYGIGQMVAAYDQLFTDPTG